MINVCIFLLCSDGQESSGGSGDDDEEQRKANQKIFVIGLISVPVLYYIVSSVLERVIQPGESTRDRELRYVRMLAKYIYVRDFFVQNRKTQI